ncbi:MAG: hypothetical protein U0X92_15570 [Anaerolineales bacterium]
MPCIISSNEIELYFLRFRSSRRRYARVILTCHGLRLTRLFKVPNQQVRDFCFIRLV